jgi:hypothetical protein
MKNKTIEELEKELEELKASNKASWDTYGSELCAGDMLGKEAAIQKEIQRLKELQILREKGLVDENDVPIPSNPLQFLKLDDDLLLQLIGGDGNRVTVRQGRRDIKLDELLFVGTKDKGLRYIVTVTEVRHLRMVDIPDDVVDAEGFDNWHDFYADMKKFYPDLDLTDEVTVIYFETADVKTQK